jgi:hypothetical protein
MGRKQGEPTQRTPKRDERTKFGLPGEGGYEIPIPNRDTFRRNMEKVAPVVANDLEAPTGAYVPLRKRRKAGKGVTQEAVDSATQPGAGATNEG